jgi:raffinose/stachyose/melibiose transport system permease protein
MNRRTRHAIGDDLVFMAPAFLFFTVIVLVSFLMGFYYSFTEWNGVNREPIWIGFENYRTMFQGDSQAGVAAAFTARFTVVSVVIANLLAFVLALALSMPLRSANVMRTIIFLPNVIGGIILGFVWRFYLHQQYSDSRFTFGDRGLPAPLAGYPGDRLLGIGDRFSCGSAPGI